MIGIRRLFKDYPRLLVLVFCAALAMKILVPSGYMVSQNSKSFTIEVCNGVENSQTTIEIPFAPETSDSSPHDGSGDSASKPCPFSGLSHSLMSRADPVQLGLAILFLLLVGLQRQDAPHLFVSRRLRPPLRAPPLLA